MVTPIRRREGVDRRVVITGMGVVSPVGNSVEEAWGNIVAGRSGIGPITSFDAANLEVKIAGEVRGFDPLTYIPAKEARHMDRFIQLGVAAAAQAMQSASYTVTPENAYTTGVLFTSAIGGIATIVEQQHLLDEKGARRVTPFLVPMMVIDLSAGNISIQFGLKGPNFSPVSACASSAHSIGEGYEIIRRGDATAILAGGSEATIVPLVIAGFDSMRALSHRNDEPERASRPFDGERDGFVIAEGAACLVLEDRETALERGAPVLAEVVGYGTTSDASHLTAPAEGGEGLARAIARALGKAGLAPEQIGYLNAHGTSTPLNEKFETLAIKRAFGEYAYKVPVSSTKSMTGHLLGAAGALEAVFCVKAMETGCLSPTINQEVPDPDCDLDYGPHRLRDEQLHGLRGTQRQPDFRRARPGAGRGLDPTFLGSASRRRRAWRR
jgi:3-oxoacyl-[acyl-carrier-protein] synthase II